MYPCLFYQVAVLPFSNIQMIYAGYVKVAPAATNWSGKTYKFLQVPEKLNFHCVKRKNPLGLLQERVSSDHTWSKRNIIIVLSRYFYHYKVT